MRAWLERKLLRYLFNYITEDDVLVYKNNRFYIGKEELPQNDVQDIVSGARALENMLVWKVLTSGLEQVASERIHKTGESPDAIRSARATLYAVDVMKKKVANLSRIK